MESLLCQILTGRWFMIFACILIMSTAGASYTFSIYSSDIKSALGYDQTTVNLLSFSKDVGSNFGIVAGLIMEVTPPWVVLALAAAFNFFGYFMIWAAVVGKIAKPAVWHMCMYIAIGCNSQASTNTGALIPGVKNFPESRGVVLGLLKGYVGLSGAIITQVYHAVYGDDSTSLILMISILPSIAIIIFLKTIRIIKATRQPDELKVFYKFLYISIALAGCLMVILILQKLHTFNRLQYTFSAVVVTIFLILPIVVVIREEIHLYRANREHQEAVEQAPKIEIVTETVPPPPPTADNKEHSAGCFQDVFNPPARGEDYSILQGLFSIDMLIICLATGSGIGGTITAMDNMGQIGASLGYPKQSISIFVSLISIWSFFGRVITGYGSEILLQKYNFPRPMIICLTLILACAGHILIALNIPNGLYISSVIIGFCSGAQWPMMYAVISEVFGLKYYATLYNFGTMASPVGSYILNVLIVGRMYDKEAKKQLAAAGLLQKAGKALDCHGGQCYRKSFIIITAASAFGSLMWFVLVLRTRKFYSGDIYKKYREEVKPDEGEIEIQSRTQTSRN